jgi:Ca-activated chloride channel family protein
VNYPVLTDLQLDMGGAQTDLMYPRSIPDAFRGSQVTLIGRYSNESDLKSLQLKLTGKAGASTRTYTYPNLSFPLRSDANDYLPRLWATRRVGWLMEQVRSNGEQKELRDEIVDLGTRYGIVTPYTSYLALEDERTTMNFMVRPGNVQQRQGAEFGNLGSLAPASAPKVLAQTGEEAVQLSKMQREAQDLIRLKDNTRKDAVKRVESKTFYLIDGVWTDSEFKAESQLPETVLVFGSDEYFALLKQNPKLGSYFSLGERVVVVIEGHVYRVNAPTP